MTAKERLVAALVSIYPPSWRREYGDELASVLLTTFSGRAVADVLWNGLAQRLRSLEPSTVIGLITMVVIIGGVVRNITGAPPYGTVFGAPFIATSLTLPKVIIQPVSEEMYLLMLLLCGWWTDRRRDYTRIGPGRASVRACVIAHIPIVIAGLLMWAGVLGMVAVGPGDTTATSTTHGFTYTFYSVDGLSPAAWHFVLAPVFRLPQSWLWVSIGVWLSHTFRARAGVATC